MSKLILSLINAISSPFVGKGYIDKHFPFLITIYEFLYTQFQPNSIVEVSIPQNLKLMVYSRDTHVGMQLLSGRLFEPTLTSRFLAIVEAGNVVLDIGANAGYYTVLAGNDAIRGQVYAVEPDRRNFSLLEKNIKLNELKNTTVHNIALGSKDGKVFFRENDLHMGKSSVVSGQGVSDYEVEMETLDTFCLENNIKNIDVMKIDVEGLETEVLRGGQKILSQSQNAKLFLEYNERSMGKLGFTRQDLFGAIGAAGLKPVSILDDITGKVIDFSFDNLDTVLSRVSYTNILCTK